MNAASIHAAHDAAVRRVLHKYGVPPEARLGGGMEAEVYAVDSATVLKIYANPAAQADLRILRDFYESLDRSRVPYALPRILDVTQEDELLVTVEQRLTGTPLSEILPARSSRQIDTLLQRYRAASLALSQIEAPAGFRRYKLFDPAHLSDRSHGDWHQFLARYITHQLARSQAYLERDVPGFLDKLNQLHAILRQPYTGEHRLIHGDFFPGNLLVNAADEITALLDFGLMTMYGDPLFDVATGWVLFDMYDALKIQAHNRYLNVLRDHLGTDILGKLHRYILIYSILTANLYSSTCADGHYAWCVRNLNHAPYWNALA